jgi:hypothetical protein
VLQESTKTLLQSILRSLETAGEAGWDDRLESGSQCLYEMHQMTRPSYRAYRMDRLDAKWPAHIPDCHKLSRAMPHVKAMVTAIRHRDQARALQSGKLAIAEL